MSFKRGFLNSKKGRDALAADPARSEPKVPESVIEPTHEDESGPSVNEESQSDPPAPSAGESKYSVVPLDLHAPAHWQDYHTTKTRFIFLEWPRAPDGQTIPYDHPEYGKQTSNGCPLWGETLHDFYITRRVPSVFEVITYYSGSHLADWMRSFGELDTAVDALKWAKSEGDPKQIFPCDIGKLVRDREPWLGRFCLPPPTLQSRLPFHLLPERLIVHDPWNTLSVDNVYEDEQAESEERKDIVHTFELSLSDEGKRKQLVEREAAEADNKARMEAEDWHILRPGDDNPGPDVFAISAKIPPRPPRPTSIPEAHLYIRREDKCGSGNHSAVYFSELELPRWAFVDDVLCPACFETAIQKEIDEQDEAGTLVPKNSDGEEMVGEIKQTKTIVRDRSTAVLGTEEVVTPEGNSETYRHRGCAPREVIMNEYTGPTAYVYPKASWQNPERGLVCEHLKVEGLNPPHKSRVKVCAKLSKQGDQHLAREAENYQAFPDHFFEHWNGYNLVRPLHDPTPCGALVPQFYGYYVPKGGFEPVVDGVVKDPVADNAPHLPKGYISPILLLEHCGVPIKLDDLSKDDKHLCAAMYFLFMKGGWAQNSVAERNVVVQPGPITEWPVFRGEGSRERSFRLIDFGRASPDVNADVYRRQKDEIYNLFELVHGFF